MIEQIQGPTLLLNESVCRSNIRRMIRKTESLALRFRPHFKTHQSHSVARWFREEGVEAITVSSLSMAEYFASDGWEDIAIAFPLNVRQLDRINRLAARIRLHLSVEDPAHLDALDRHLRVPVGLYISVDCGYGRTGLPPSAVEKLRTLTRRILEHHLASFSGLLAHAGHTYAARGESEIARIHRQSIEQLGSAAAAIRDLAPAPLLSYGDTPSCSTQTDLGPVGEIRPGNFVFYDLTQWQIGSCKREEIAVALAAPVVARHEDRREVIVHGGATHLAKDHLQMPDGQLIYGQAVPLRDEGWESDRILGYVRSLSQEHGTIRLTEAAWPRISVGDLLAILPVHSCHAAYCMGAYHNLNGGLIERLGPAGQVNPA